MCYRTGRSSFHLVGIDSHLVRIDLLRSGFLQKGITQKDFKETLKLLLAFTSWVDESNQVKEVKDSDTLVSIMLDLLKNVSQGRGDMDGAFRKFMQ